MSALAAEWIAASPAAVDELTPGLGFDPVGAGGSLRAARSLLSDWLQQCLRAASGEDQARPAPPLPLAGIEHQLQQALRAAGHHPARPAEGGDLLRTLHDIAGLLQVIPLGRPSPASDPARARQVFDHGVRLALEMLQSLTELEIDIASQQAWLDPLTGLPGRRALQQRLLTEHARLRRHAEGCALALIDLDQFKPVNDRHGHLVGDRYLAAFAHALREALRAYDAAFRYGGDEFVLCLPQTGVEQAQAVIQRIREQLAGQCLVRVGDEALYARFSAGVAALDASKPVLQTLGEADAQLYVAKRGRRAFADAAPR